MVCGKLRASGFDCLSRKTDFAAGAWTGSLASGGPVAVLVEEQDITVARRLIPSA